MKSPLAIPFILLLAVSVSQALTQSHSAFATELSTARSPSNGAELLTHHLLVKVDPDRHRLVATDEITLKIRTSQSQLSFSINKALRVTRIFQKNNKATQVLSFWIETGSRQDIHGAAQRVAVRLEAPPGEDGLIVLEWHYEGMINDPPQEPRHLRFVTPSETAGHIGPEGVYLSGETYWYPDLQGSVSTYRVSITTPAGWLTVSHGRLTAETVRGDYTLSEWDITSKTEALTIVANRFVKRERQWNQVAVVTYLFPDDAALADEYLAASVTYLETYTKLLGPYPFPKFAIVENFFASGLGMPSFTLLGSGVIKRHYVQPYALGHEIVHSWIGNWVFNDMDTGNWVEGLTTYLANYYYDELQGTPEQATAQRRMMLLGYALYVRSEDDYPVGRFRHKTDQKDNAIGYQKAAMIFHMLRREIGDDVFWQGLKRLVADFGGMHASWGDVERMFTQAAQRDLRWFFKQWVEQKGAPRLVLSDAQAIRTEQDSGKRFQIQVRLIQTDPSFRLRLPVRVRMQDGRIEQTEVDIRSGEQMITIGLPMPPVSLEVDPDFEAFRRIDRQQLPPMLNLFVTDRERFVVLPETEQSAARQPYEDIVTRLKNEAAVSAVRVKTDGEFSEMNTAASLDGSVLVLGGPGLNRLAAWALGGCGDRIRLDEEHIIIDGRTYEGPDVAVLASCRHPDRPDHVATVFYGHTPSAAARVARLLFFYGWHSYLIFREGAVVTRGDFLDPESNLEVQFNGS